MKTILLNKTRVLFLVFLLFLLTTKVALAASIYVLPYPGLMPGNRLYQIEQIFDRLYRFWAFGNFSRHQYELKLADKKIVEAKVLFEYKQYLLASRALADSNQHFQKAVIYLDRAAGEGKDISQKRAVLQAAAEKHQEVLKELSEKLPAQFLWQPEKETATELNLEKAIAEAMEIREI